jgi:DNA replication and repair protein RecF
LALFIEPASVDDRQRYLLALRQRQRALEERGPLSSEIDAFEAIAADHGARLTRARHAAVAELHDELAKSFRAVAPAELELADRYVPGGTIDPAEFRTELWRRRAIDARRGLATFGPQRDEIELELAGRSARHHASQGQQRILTLALKLAELASIRRARGAHPVLLLDDVSSELDPRRTGAVYELVSAADSQVFVTTARRDLLERAALETNDRADFRIENGALERL